MNLLSSAFASIANIFSGAESSFCIIWHLGDIDCPKELNK